MSQVVASGRVAGGVVVVVGRVRRGRGVRWCWGPGLVSQVAVGQDRWAWAS